MRKTDKKLDKQIRIVLTDVCETGLKEFVGFQWLTHLVNYDNFPESLKVICVFDTNESLSRFKAQNSHHGMNALIRDKLLSIGIKIGNVDDHVAYDSEEHRDKNSNRNGTEKYH